MKEDNANIENMKEIWWNKKPYPTKEYILLCILEEMREMNEHLSKMNGGKE